MPARFSALYCLSVFLASFIRILRSLRERLLNSSNAALTKEGSGSVVGIDTGVVTANEVAGAASTLKVKSTTISWVNVLFMRFN